MPAGTCDASGLQAPALRPEGGQRGEEARVSPRGARASWSPQGRDARPPLCPARLLQLPCNGLPPPYRTFHMEF